MTKTSRVQDPLSISPAPENSNPSTNSFSTLYSPKIRQSNARSSVNHETLDPANQSRRPDSSAQYGANSKHAPLSGLTKLRTLRADSAVTQDSYVSSQPFDELDRPLPDHRLRADALGFDRRSGFTNNSALLCEHEFDLGIFDSPAELDLSLRIDQVQIDRGAAVLSLLKDLTTVRLYIDKLVCLYVLVSHILG